MSFSASQSFWITNMQIMSTECVFDIFGWKNSFQSKNVHDQVNFFNRKF